MTTTENYIIISRYSTKNEGAAMLMRSLDGKIIHQRQVMLSEGMNLIQVPAAMARGTIKLVALRANQHVSSIKVMR